MNKLINNEKAKSVNPYLLDFKRGRGDIPSIAEYNNQVRRVTWQH